MSLSRSASGRMNVINMGDDESSQWLKTMRLALHDMGSPLSAMRVLLEVLRLTDGNPARKAELIGMMDKQVGELAVRLDALLSELPAVDFTIDDAEAAPGTEAQGFQK